MRLIDADALVEQMEAEAKYCEDSICKLVYEMDIREVKRAPTVSPDMAQVLAYECGKAERKRGKWINDKGLYKCSECNNFTITGWADCIPIKQMYKVMKYCNNCGAEMRGEANERNN